MMMWLASTEMGLPRLIVEGEFFLDLDHEVHLKYLGQDLEQKMMKMKEVDKLLLMNVFFCWRLVHLDVDFQGEEIVILDVGQLALVHYSGCLDYAGLVVILKFCILCSSCKT